MGLRELSILVIDDSPSDVELLQRHLENIAGVTIALKVAHNAETGLKALEDPQIEVIILDYLLGDTSGMDVLERIRAKGDMRAIIVSTGMTSTSLVINLARTGADDYVDKNSMTPDILRRAIDNAQAQQRQREAFVENKRLLNDIQEANRLLERKNARLAELYDTAHQFVDNVSHEFRTPLAVIKEYASLVHDGIVGSVNDEQKEFLDVIGNRVEDLALMVDDMLDISRFGIGMIHVSRQTCRIEDTIKHIQSTLERRAAINKVQLNIKLDPNLPDLYCDPEKIGRIIINLSVNAIKFAPESGHVTIAIHHDTPREQIEISITDNGSGISPENQQLIFERFKQVHTDLRQSTKGFGLGLNIAKELVHMNFGLITLESKLGQGSKFSFSVPTAESLNIITRYQHWLKQIEETSAVAILWAKPDPASDSTVTRDAGDFLRTNSRPKDLVFVPTTGTYLLVARCEKAEIQNLVQRLENALEQANRNRPVNRLPRIHYKIDGTWQLPDDAAEFSEHFKQAMTHTQAACG